MKNAVIYARVSSRQDGRDFETLHNETVAIFRLRNDFSILKEFVDVETAKTSGRLLTCPPESSPCEM